MGYRYPARGAPLHTQTQTQTQRKVQMQHANGNPKCKCELQTQRRNAKCECKHKGQRQRPPANADAEYKGGVQTGTENANAQRTPQRTNSCMCHIPREMSDMQSVSNAKKTLTKTKDLDQNPRRTTTSKNRQSHRTLGPVTKRDTRR